MFIVYINVMCHDYSKEHVRKRVYWSRCLYIVFIIFVIVNYTIELLLYHELFSLLIDKKFL